MTLPSRSLTQWSVLALAVGLIVTGCAPAADPPSGPGASALAGPDQGGPQTAAPDTAPPAPNPDTGSSAGRMQDPTAAGPGTSVPAAAPVRVAIPSIGVDAPLEVLSRDAADVLQPPVAWEAAGWYDESPVPGERGPSVIAGHLVATDGPAVFVDLGKLVPGDMVDVVRSDGSVAIFEVDRTISAERTDSFPSAEIYGPTPDAQLRLITCDGEYDPDRGHWTRNMVVFASLVDGGP